jgi:hypothetical protein
VARVVADEGGDEQGRARNWQQIAKALGVSRATLYRHSNVVTARSSPATSACKPTSHWTASPTVADDAASDGAFPLISNDRSLSDAQLLGAYRYQPNLERRHHLLKGVQGATPVLLPTTMYSSAQYLLGRRMR